MLTRKVSPPWASLEIATVVMSGANAFSPTASWNVALLAATRAGVSLATRDPDRHHRERSDAARHEKA